MILAPKKKASFLFLKWTSHYAFAKTKEDKYVSRNGVIELYHLIFFFFFFDKQRELNETGLAKQPQTESRGCIQQVPQDLYKRNKKHKHHKLRS